MIRRNIATEELSRNKGKVFEVRDWFSLSRKWLIMRGKDGHYYINESVHGILVYSRMQRISKSALFHAGLIK